MSNDIFAPPTDEELKMFAPPSKEELGASNLGDIGQLEALGVGALKGASMGFSDEAIAALKTIPELSKMDPEAIKTAYYKARDARRAYEEEVAQQHPVITTAGEIAGGLAIPLGGIGAGKGLLGAVKAGAVLGGVGALGETKDITELPQTAKDVAKGAALGAVVAPALEGSVGAVGKLSKWASSFEKPANILKAYEVGKEGISLADNKENVKKLQEAVEELAPSLREESVKAKAATAAAKQDVKQNITKLEDEIGTIKNSLQDSVDEQINQLKGAKEKDIANIKADTDAAILKHKQELASKQKQLQEETDNLLKQQEVDFNKNKKLIENDIKTQISAEKDAQLAENYQDKINIAKDINKQAEVIQNKINTQYDKLGGIYNTLESQIPQESFKINAQNAADKFMQVAKAISGKTPAELKTIIESFPGAKFDENGALVGFRDLTMPEFKDFKKTINMGVEKSEGPMSAAFRSAYGTIMQDFENTLANQPELLNQFKTVNKQWQNINALDNYVNSVDVDRATGEILAGGKTARTVEAYFDPTKAANQRMVEQFEKHLTGALPEEAPQISSSLSELGQLGRQVKSFEPKVSTSEEMLANNPEYIKLKEMLEKVKATKPAELEQIKEEGAAKLAELKAKSLEDIASTKEKYTEQIGALQQNLPKQIEEATKGQVAKIEAFKNVQIPEETSKLLTDLLGSNAVNKINTPEGVEQITKMIENSTKKLNADDRIRFDKMIENLKALPNVNAEQVKTKLIKLAEIAKLSNIQHKKSMLNQPGLMGALGQTAEAAAVNAGNLAGLTVNKLLSSENLTSQLPMLMAKMTEKGFTKYANLLEKIGAAPLSKKRALVYTLLQEPEFRKTVDDILKGE